MVKDIVSGFLSGIGQTAKDIRVAITGLEPEKQAEIELKLIDLERTALDAQSQVIIAEAKGESWLQRNWRPITMLVIVAIIAYNYLLMPFLRIFWHGAIILDLPDGLWALMQLGLGGYIVSRGAEKVTENLKR